MRDINLLPEENQKAENMRMVRQLAVLNVLPFLAVMAVIHGLLVLDLHYLEGSNAYSGGGQEPVHIQQVRKQIALIKLKGQKLLETDKNLVEDFVVNLPVSKIAGMVGNMALGKVWLSDLTLDLPKATCEINGRSYGIRLVSEFMLDLKQVVYFKNVDLVAMEHNNKEKNDEITFKIVCVLK